MTRDELEKEATEFEENYTVYEIAKRKNGTDYTKKVCDVTVKEAYVAGAEPREKRISELEEKISVLLSCKNCPENKGGLLCQKEYENKCLAQKIQFIKELQKENTELKGLNNGLLEEGRLLKEQIAELQGENAELKEKLKKAKQFIRDFLSVAIDYIDKEDKNYSYIEEGWQFLKESE